MVVDSPHRPGVGARPMMFAGRGAQVQRAERMLAAVANSGAAAPAPMVITGPRGVGKTVLLQVIRDEAVRRGFETAVILFDTREWQSSGAGVRGRGRVAVFIDEVHEAPVDDLRTVATAVQDLIQTPRTPLVVFLAGLPETSEVLISANSFAERFDYLPVPRLTVDAAHRVLLDPALDLGVRWAPPALQEVVTVAAGNPFMLQSSGMSRG